MTTTNMPLLSYSHSFCSALSAQFAGCIVQPFFFWQQRNVYLHLYVCYSYVMQAKRTWEAKADRMEGVARSSVLLLSRNEKQTYCVVCRFVVAVLSYQCLCVDICGASELLRMSIKRRQILRTQRRPHAECGGRDVRRRRGQR